MHTYLLSGPANVEPLLEQEISQAGGDIINSRPGGVLFKAQPLAAYRVLMESRLGTRLLRLISEAKVEDDLDLYQAAICINWPELFKASASFAVHFEGTSRSINNSMYGALKVKDAIVDKFRRANLPRPNVEPKRPDVRIVASLHRGQVSFYLDYCGKPLSMRGYRAQNSTAPLKENLAAALLYRAGWLSNPTRVFVDPMCGSGTIVIEAALMAQHRAPGLSRKRYCVKQLNEFDSGAWQQAQELATQAFIESPEVQLYAHDIDVETLAIAKTNAEAAGVAHLINFSQQDCTQLSNPYGEQGLILTNPPYGERLGEELPVLIMHGQFGQQLKQHFCGWSAGVFSANPGALDQLRLRADKRYNLRNGPLEGVLALYEIKAATTPTAAPQHAPDFVNRLKKNQQRLKKWLTKEQLSAYRLYDADLPEYNFAIDRYNDWWVVQEYAPPKQIDENKARRRREDALVALATEMQIDLNKLVVKTRAVQKGKSQYQRQEQKQRHWIEVEEYGARFWVNPSDYLDTGLFLDHRLTRQRLQQMAAGKRFLNLFCYTASGTVHAALGGAASSVSVDMSNTYLEWAERNFKLNGLDLNQHQRVRANCMEWLDSADQSFDLVFVDPPSFSNSKRMEGVFDVQRDHVQMLTLISKCLSPGAKVVFSNNLRRFKLDQEALETLGYQVTAWSKQTLPPDFERNPKIHQCWLLEWPERG